jgi:uncharacterized OB-fold protein
MTTTQVPIAEGIFTWPEPAGGAQLIGSRCRRCGTITFPRQHGCPNCTAEEMEDTLLARRGTLWTWTTQGFLPKEPYRGPETEDDYQPFTLGYVELPGEVKVETRLTEPDPDRLAIGMEMELVLVPFRRDADGTEVMTFAFRPVPATGDPKIESDA